MKSIAEVIAEQDAKAAQGQWVPACGGLETPFLSRSGKVLLYCWQPSTGRHAYLDVRADVFMTDEDAAAAMWPA